VLLLAHGRQEGTISHLVPQAGHFDAAEPDMSISQAPGKTWRRKLANSQDLPKKAKIDAKLPGRRGEGTYVIPAPLEVDEAMQTICEGKLTTIEAISSALAKKHETTTACEVTTGIFAWIAAHAADEAECEGDPLITPYWRTLKSGGEINAKYPGGVDNVRARLEAEGHRIVQKGKRFFVADYEHSLVVPQLDPAF
jgi:hypothetical protein